MKKALKRRGSPEAITDGLRSYEAAMTDLGCRAKQAVGRWANNRVENSRLPFRRRERAMLRFRRIKALHGAVRATRQDRFLTSFASLGLHSEAEREGVQKSAGPVHEH